MSYVLSFLNREKTDCFRTIKVAPTGNLDVFCLSPITNKAVASESLIVLAFRQNKEFFQAFEMSQHCLASFWGTDIILKCMR